MFTRQATQLQSALQGQFGNTPTAQDMIQALCNCAQTIEHRGPMEFSFTDPNYGQFPGIRPPPGLIPPPAAPSQFPQSEPGYTFINFPPWQPLTFEGQEFIDFSGPDGWNGWDGTNFTLNFAGPQYTLDSGGTNRFDTIESSTVSTQTFTTEQITNQGDTFTYGDTFVDGDVFHAGDTVHGGATVHEGPTTHEQTVTNQGPVINEGAVTNLGDTFNHGANTFFSPVTIVVNGQPRQTEELDVLTSIGFDIMPNGDLRVSANSRRVSVFAAAAGRFLSATQAPNEAITMVTDVAWDAATLTFVKTRREYNVFGVPAAAAVDSDVFVADGAKFDPDICEIVIDNAIPPEYMPIVAP